VASTSAPISEGVYEFSGIDPLFTGFERKNIKGKRKSKNAEGGTPAKLTIASQVKRNSCKRKTKSRRPKSTGKK